ncbi:hypothetical protein C8J57DRAFT_1277998 [Mycena rebaudengoi]|nr:hypothetical protein C8J57DRAFT_1277998 [Mycena rebaudengoi]
MSFEVPAFPSSHSRIFAAVWPQQNQILKPLPWPVRAPRAPPQAQSLPSGGSPILPSTRRSPARGFLPLPPDVGILFGIKGCARAALSSSILQLQLHFRLLLLLHLQLLFDIKGCAWTALSSSIFQLQLHFRLLLLHLQPGGGLMRDQFLTQKPFFLLEGLDGALRHLYTINQVRLNSRQPIYFFLELRDSHARFFEGIGK